MRAILHALGKGPNNCIGHKESTKRKIDPSFDMVAFRHLLTYVPPPMEDDMPLTDAEIAKIADATHARFIRYDAAGKAEGISAQSFDAIQQIRRGEWLDLGWLDVRINNAAAAIVHEVLAADPHSALDPTAIAARITDLVAEGIKARLDG